MKDLNDYDSNKANSDINNGVDSDNDRRDDNDEKSVSTKSRDDVKIEIELRKQISDKRSIHLHQDFVDFTVLIFMKN
jgi:hypothetical protein